MVYPVVPGSPVGIQPSVANTIQQSFNKQRVTNGKAAVKAGLHADTKNRIIQFLARLLRVMPVDQLVTLSDPDLVHQALQLLTTENFSGSVRLPDSSTVFMRDCIIEVMGNSKTREGHEIKKQLNIERFTNKQTDDGSEVSLDDDFSSIGLFDYAQAQASFNASRSDSGHRARTSR